MDRRRTAQGGMIRRLPGRATLLVAVLAMAAAAAAGGETGPRSGFMRGMVVSCPTWGPIWGSPHMAEALADMRRLGVDWIAIHPYAGVRRSGTVRITPADSTDFLPRAVELTREAGMKLFWKPHLAYWGSFRWRGEIAFGDDEAAWRRFFDGYHDFIVDQARFAEQAGAELFAVGVETDATLHREEEWRRIVAAVRRVYSGRITYAANWDSVGKVGFWDSLDVIGVHAYYPLAEEDDPDADSLRRGWDAHLEGLRRLVAAEDGKPVVFAELGYNRSPDAARRPWEYETRDTAESRALRGRLIDVALTRLAAEPMIEGVFWWKWIPGDNRFDRDFSMRDPEAREALARHWPASR